MGQLLDCLGTRKPKGRQSEEEEGERLEDSGTRRGDGVQWPVVVSVPLCHSSRGRVQASITMRGGRSGWVEMSESTVRCYTTGKYEQ